MAIGDLPAARRRGRRVRFLGLRLSRLALHWSGGGRGRRSAPRGARVPPPRGAGGRVPSPPPPPPRAPAREPGRLLPGLVSRSRVGLRLSGLAFAWLRGRPRRRPRAPTDDAAPPVASMRRAMEGSPPPPGLPPPSEAKVTVVVKKGREETTEELPLYRQSDLDGRYMGWFNWPRPADAIIGVFVPPQGDGQFSAACDGKSLHVCPRDSTRFSLALNRMRHRIVARKATFLEETYGPPRVSRFCLTQLFEDLHGSLEDGLQMLEVEERNIRWVPSPSAGSEAEQTAAVEAFRAFCIANFYIPWEERVPWILPAGQPNPGTVDT